MAHRPLLPRIPSSGTVIRLSDGPEQIVIMPVEAVEVLSSRDALDAIDARLRDRDARQAMADAAATVRYEDAELRKARGQRPSARKHAIQTVKEALTSGRLLALKHAPWVGLTATELGRTEPVPEPPRPPTPGPSTPEPLHKYRIHVIDDTNADVANVKLKLEIAGTPRMATTGGDGRAVAEWYSAATATLRILNQSEIEKALEKQFTKPASPKLPRGSDVTRLPIGSPFAELKAPADSETTVIITRPGTYVIIELVDGDGQAVGNVPYELTCSDGTPCSGTLDEKGHARVDGLPRGPYKVSFPDLNEADWVLQSSADV